MKRMKNGDWKITKDEALDMAIAFGNSIELLKQYKLNALVEEHRRILMQIHELMYDEEGNLI